MRVRDLLFITVLALLFAAFILGSMIYILVMLPEQSKTETHSVNIECGEQDFKPLCLSKQYLRAFQEKKVDVVEL